MAESLAPRHHLQFTPGGLLAELAGCEHGKVNSLHGQGIDALADELQVEAVAEDGTIEAVTVKNSIGFALGVQWHAEHTVREHPLHMAIFRAFGEAVAQHAAVKREANISKLALV